MTRGGLVLVAALAIIANFGSIVDARREIVPDENAPLPIMSCICLDYYKPVCCLRAGVISTASNSCYCGCSKGQVVPGDCGGLAAVRPLVN
jgi:hypothetical protein